MISIRIWNLESDQDAGAVKFLGNEFLRYRQLEYLATRTSGKSALRKCHRKGVFVNSSLMKAIQHYLKQDDYIIFLVGCVDPQRQQGSNPLIIQLRHVVEDCGFSDRVFFAPEIQEYEPSTPTQWQNIVSRFHTAVETDRNQFREKWDKTMTHFHDAFADTPEEEVIRDFEEALAEVRCRRVKSAYVHK